MPHNRTVAIFIASIVSTACATIMHGSSQDVGITSNPTRAIVAIDNQNAGHTPFVARLSRREAHVVRISAEGYEPAELTLTRHTSNWVWGNIIFGGLVGVAVDAISGGLYKLSPEQLAASLTTQSASVTPARNGFYVVLVPHADASWT